MKRITVCALLLAALLGPTRPGRCADPQAQPSGRLEEVVVTATRTDKKIDEAPASVTVITRQDMERMNVRTVDEALKNEAGVYNFRPRGIADTTANVGMRGLYGASRVLVLVNGMPATDAYTFNATWNNLPVNDIERIEVVRGAASALYGSNAMGGVINIITRKPQKREVETVMGVGTQNTYRYGLRAGDRVDDSVSLSANFEGEQTGGYAPSLVTKSGAGTAGVPNISGGYGTVNNSGTSIWVIGDSGDNRAGRWATSGMISSNSTSGEVNFDFNLGRHVYGYGEPNSLLTGGAYSGNVGYNVAGRYYTVYPADFLGAAGMGQEDLGRVALSYTTRLDAVEWTSKLTYQMKKKWYTTANAGAVGNPTAGYYDDAGKLSDAGYDDLNLETQFTRKLFGNHVLTGGASWRWDTFGQRQYNLTYYQDIHSKTGESVHLKGQDQVFGLFAQYEWPLADTLTVYVGLRLDDWQGYGGSSTTPTAHTSFANHNYFTANPKLSAVWNPLEDTFLRASAAKAFCPPTLYQLYSDWSYGGTTYRSNPNLRPEHAYAYEVGGDQYFLARKLKLSVAVYHTDLFDAITSSSVGGVSNTFNVDKATVDGYELEASYQPRDWVRVWYNYANNYAKYRKFDLNPNLEGKWMTSVPQELTKIGTEFTFGVFKLNLTGNYVGRVYSNALNSDINSDKPSGYSKIWLFNGKLSAEVTKSLTASLAVNNIFDETYYASYIGQPRNALFELRYKF